MQHPLIPPCLTTYSRPVGIKTRGDFNRHLVEVRDRTGPTTPEFDGDRAATLPEGTA